jgi:hypothetical protein
LKPWRAHGAVAARALALVAGIGGVAGALWHVSAQSADGVVETSNVADAAPEADPDKDATPMAQRVATIGFLNKRNGVTRDFQMKPGDNFRVADGVIIRLRACDTTAPWEHDPYTGAFVQVDIQNAANKWIRVFSGWLYKESPSLNVVEHPVYDVWVKACKMNHGEPPASAQKADSGSGDEAAGTPAHHRPKLKKSPAVDTPETAAPADGGGDTQEASSPQ